ncbi:MAG: hypothetical protein CH6_2199 [Candidatus Kapaibacterium sp.]|nr:MAG: hypothetical protein CH6_2199 [Candidatus Kapabacteria bacterium]
MILFFGLNINKSYNVNYHINLCLKEEQSIAFLYQILLLLKIFILL